MLQEALKYLSMGWSVVPLKPKEKIPSIEWKEYQTRLPTREELKHWFTSTNTPNIAVVTGKVSNLVVVDLDGAEGLNEGLRLNLHSPITNITGRGKQLFYKHPGDVIRNTVKKYPGVDLRGDGGYVVVPPSIHPTGKRYHWLVAPSVKGLSAFPTKIFTQVTESAVATDSIDWISEAIKELQNGHVHNVLVSVLGKFRHHNFSEDATFKLLEPHALVEGKPFIGLRAKISEIWGRYPSGLTKTGIVLRTFANSLEDYHTRRKTRVGSIEFPTGFKKLDRLTGGLRRQELLTIAARTGTGKTNWLIGASKNLCEQGKSVLFFSTEMSYDAIWDRYLCTLDASEVLERHRFIVCDDFVPDINRVEEAIREANPDVFVFDHINHVGEEHQGLAEFMQGLKMLSRKFNIPGIVAAQLNRLADWVDAQTHERVVPRMSMIKGSGTIEQVSAQVLLLSETSVAPDQNEIIGNLDKNRYGNQGLVDFVLRKDPLRIEELE